MVRPLADELPGLLIEGIELYVVVVRNPPLPRGPMCMPIVIMRESFPKVEIHELTLSLGQHVHLPRTKWVVAVGRGRRITGLEERIQVWILTPLLVLDPSFGRRAGASEDGSIRSGLLDSLRQFHPLVTLGQSAAIAPE